jgi:hypothetical protein
MSDPMQEGLFVFPMLVGTALSSRDLQLDPTDYIHPIPIIMTSFSQCNVNSLVKDHFKSGEQLLVDNQLGRLMVIIGGVGRPLERLKEVLDKYELPIKDWSAVLRQLRHEIQELYSDGQPWIGNTGGSGGQITPTRPN